jgi:hypothetical protein
MKNFDEEFEDEDGMFKDDDDEQEEKVDCGSYDEDSDYISRPITED